MKTSLFVVSILITCALSLLCEGATAQVWVIAHRGYWDCEGSAQNSIASLQKAQEIGIYGSEFDVSVTSDGIPVVNHDSKINGLLIEETSYEKLKDIIIANGEKLPTLDAFLKQGKKDNQTKLILEIKPHSTKEKEDKAVEIIVKKVVEFGLTGQVEYISFSLNICKEIIRLQPGVPVAYLNGDIAPEELNKIGLSGLDYHHKVLKTNKNWINEAKQSGLSINTWTVNNPEDIREMIGLGVDFITTDKPLIAKEFCSTGNNEVK